MAQVISIQETLKQANEALAKRQYNKAFTFFMVASMAQALKDKAKQNK